MAETLHGREHGGDLGEARALFPHAPEPWVDLSTGINPFAYPLPDLPPAAWRRLPAPAETAALEAAAARAYGAGGEVVAVPGTGAAIAWLPRLLSVGRVGVLGPTYGEHQRAWTLAGHRVEAVASLDALAGLDVAVVVNPNNPDGRAVEPAALLGLHAALARRGGMLVVDEAFADVVPQLSVAGATGRPGLVVLRSFGKFFGLAGLRLGFALAAPSMTGRLREAVGPWAVSGEAIAVGRQALADAAWPAAMRVRLEAEAQALDAVLAGCGVPAAGGTALFRLVESPAAPALFERLGRAGLWVRRFRDRPDRLRLGLPPDAAALARLSAALTPPA